MRPAILRDAENTPSLQCTRRTTSIIDRREAPDPSAHDTLHDDHEETFDGMWQSPTITPLLQTSNAGRDSTIAWLAFIPLGRRPFVTS